MKCEKCGVDYPNKIYKLHIKRCNHVIAEESEGEIIFINPYAEMSYNEMRAEAKKKGIKFDGNPSKADLELALVGDDV